MSELNMASLRDRIRELKTESQLETVLGYIDLYRKTLQLTEAYYKKEINKDAITDEFEKIVFRLKSLPLEDCTLKQIKVAIYLTGITHGVETTVSHSKTESIRLMRNYITIFINSTL